MQRLSIKNLQEDPLLVVHEKPCKIQIGTLKIVHPMNMTIIENTIEALTSISHLKLKTNPLINIVKIKIQQLYTTFYGLKPRKHRSKRWDVIGTGFKFIAGTPDAQDLRLINYTMNELIGQNNEQVKTNMQLNERITHITDTINKIIENSHENKIISDEIETIITIINIDNINRLLDSIQDAVILSKSSLVSNKILSLRELNTIRTLLQDQGVEVNFADEALQFVIPKLALKDDVLLYILNVPQLENTTSNLLRIYPLTTNNRILHQYPTHIVQRGNNLYTTSKPEDFVQKSSFLNELQDECLVPLIHGKKATCNYVEQYETTQKLITENSILISNAKHQILKSNCGPDNRTLNGNFLISFANCTLEFNNQSFQNSELVSEVHTFERAFHNLKIEWKEHKTYDLEKISNTAVSNRQKLNHAYLRQDSLHFKLWTTFGGFSLFTILGFVTVGIFIKIICDNRANGPGRSVLKGDVVTDGTDQPPEIDSLADISIKLQRLQQQLEQLPSFSATLQKP